MKQKNKSCGSCTKCCTLIEVPELGKKEGQTCVHLTDKGCGIYEDRPQSCKDFICGFLAFEFFKPRLRPDRCGFVCCPQETDFGATLINFKDAVNSVTMQDRQSLNKIGARAQVKILWLNPDGTYDGFDSKGNST